MTTPDPRTDLAGYLGLTDDQVEDCRRRAPFHPGSVYTKVGARLIEQDQARADEPGDGLHAMLDIDALGGAKHLRETMCVAQGAVLREDRSNAYADTLQAICDVCDQHRPLGPDGKHGTRRCTPTCGCIDKRDPEPDDGLIPVTVRLTAEEARAAADELATWTDTPSYRAVNKLRDACADIDLPAPWKSPLDDLPDLTEQEARYIVQQFTPADLGMDEETQRRLPLTTNAVRKIAKALIAAGWTPEEEA